MMALPETLRMIFKPTWHYAGCVNGILTADEIKQEPMFFQAEVPFVLQHGSALSRSILHWVHSSNIIPPAGYNLLIDSRVTHTMRGYYPSIPGWHCDNVPRSEQYSQPDLSKVDPNCQHWMVNLATGQYVSNTEFMSEACGIAYDPRAVWKSIDESLEEKKPTSTFILPGQIVQFDQLDLHRASPCIDPGWRLFFRLAITKNQPKNEIRNQVQIYYPGNPGW